MSGLVRSAKIELLAAMNAATPAPNGTAIANVSTVLVENAMTVIVAAVTSTGANTNRMRTTWRRATISAPSTLPTLVTDRTHPNISSEAWSWSRMSSGIDTV